MKIGFSKTLIVVIVAAVLVVGAGVGYWFGRGSGLNAETPSLPDQHANQGSQPGRPYVGDDFTLIPPTDWIQTHISGTLVSYQNSKEAQPKDSAADKINFKSYIAVSFDKVNGQTLDKITEVIKRQLESVAPAISFAPVTNGTIGGQPAKLIEASLLMQEVDFKVMVAIAMKGDKYFTISSNTTAEKWPEYRDVFYNTLNSFKFKY